MDIRNRPMMKTAALDALRTASYDPKKLILLHSAAALVLSLLLTIVDFLLEKAIAGTGGIGGLGTRSVLSTLQSCLMLSQLILLPFWQIGYTYVTMKFARKEAAAPMDLCKGFGLFLPVLRLLIFQGLLYLGIGFIASYFGTILFMLTPWAAPLMSATMEMMYGGGNIENLNAVMDQIIMESAVPMTICGGIVFLAMAAPFFYRFRMAQYILLDEPEKGAINAMRGSWQMTRGNAFSLLKLDFSFWWFYLLDLLVSAICYADALLAALKIELPVDATVAFFATFIVYLLCQLGLYWWRKNEVDTTYAVFYDGLKQPKPPVAAKQPWSY